uniref:Uncharacterized protein n=1 Tax=Arundo donax TaxID=35708 RepID=A0A0A9BW53_ARUDO
MSRMVKMVMNNNEVKKSPLQATIAVCYGGHII